MKNINRWWNDGIPLCVFVCSGAVWWERTPLGLGFSRNISRKRWDFSWDLIWEKEPGSWQKAFQAEMMAPGESWKFRISGMIKTGGPERRPMWLERNEQESETMEGQRGKGRVKNIGCRYRSFQYLLLWDSLRFISEWSEVTQSCLTLCDPMDCSLPGFSIHGILQARVLEWVTISFFKIYRQAAKIVQRGLISSELLILV